MELDSHKKLPEIKTFREISGWKTDFSRRVKFAKVEVFYFERLQGHVCVPTQGGSTLGMALSHSSYEEFSVSDHEQVRQTERYSSLLRKFESGKLSLTPEQHSYLTNRLNYLLGKFCKTLEHEGPNSSPVFRSAEPNHAGENIRFLPYDERIESQLYGLMECYFLQLLSVKKRRLLLRKSGLKSIDHAERIECQAIRLSREICGCSCPSGACLPESCFCARNGIKCQVDRPFFPCTCVQSSQCQNPEGRIEFDPVRVRTHYFHTRMRLDKEQTIHSLETGGYIADAAQTGEPSTKKAKMDSSISPNDFPVSSKEFNARVVSSSSSAPGSVSHTNEDGMLSAYNTTEYGACLDCQSDSYVQFLALQLGATVSEDGSDVTSTGNTEYGLFASSHASDDYPEVIDGEWVDTMNHNGEEQFNDHQLQSLSEANSSNESDRQVGEGQNTIRLDKLNATEEQIRTEEQISSLCCDTDHTFVSPVTPEPSAESDRFIDYNYVEEIPFKPETTSFDNGSASEENIPCGHCPSFSLDPIASLITRFSPTEQTSAYSFIPENHDFQVLATSPSFYSPSLFPNTTSSSELSNPPASTSSSYTRNSDSPTDDVFSGSPSRATSPILESVPA